MARNLPVPFKEKKESIKKDIVYPVSVEITELNGDVISFIIVVYYVAIYCPMYVNYPKVIPFDVYQINAVSLLQEFVLNK